MDSADIVLVIVVGTALAFDFTNGFHDTANAIATSVSTRAMSPRFAVALSAVLNFAGAFISLEVAATVAQGIVEAGAVSTTVVFAGLVGAIAWNLATWWLGLPSSSSHALIGGVVGAAFAADGSAAVQGDGLVEKVLVPGVVAPILAFTVAALVIVVSYEVVGRLRPGPVNRGYRLGQIVSASMFSLAHGTNDAQKTMGIITLALIAHGDLPDTGFDVPTWVIVSSATAIALGTYTGGWRIIRTMGRRIIKMDPAQGFAAQSSGAAVVLTASHLGFPLSTTHVSSGAVMGAGAAKRLSAVRWGLAGNIAVAWVLTLPAAAVIGAVVYGATSLFGDNAAGPLVITLAMIGAIGAAFARRVQDRLVPAEG
jgi:inorganic phosphate transporter, PiT family